MKAVQFSQLVRTWRTRGAIFYSLCSSVFAVLVWDIVTSPLLRRQARSSALTAWIASSVVLCALQPLLAAAHASALKASDGFSLPSLLHVGPRSAGYPLSLAARLINRFSTPARARQSVVFLLGSFLGSGSLNTAYAVRRLGSAAAPQGIWRGPWLFGSVLGAVHGFSVLLSGKDVLEFPVLQRQRLFRTKQQLMQAVWPAVRTWLLACGVTALLMEVLPGGKGTHFWGRQLSMAALTGPLCAYLLTMSNRIAHIVFTERLRFLQETQDEGNALLFQSLASDQDAVLQAAARYDLCCLAEEYQGSARRRSLFLDESGATWHVPAQHCLQQVTELVQMVAAAQQPAVVQAASSTAASGARWNQLPQAPRRLAGAVQPTKVQDRAVLHVAAHWQACAWAMRTLAALLAASQTEDVYGVVQLTEPTIGTVTTGLLAAALALEGLMKAAPARSGLPMRHVLRAPSSIDNALGPPNAVNTHVYALHDTAMIAINHLTGVFGSELVPLVRDASVTKDKTTPQAFFGQPAELLVLLRSCLPG